MTEYAEIGKHFKSDFAEAKLTVQREDGLDRRLRFAAPKTMNSLVLVTWPYNLLVAGSHGSYHFERYGDDTEDMFNWLRGIRVEPSSWASKLVNGADSVREYDRDLLVQQVKDEVAEAVREDAPRGLRAAVREQILENNWLHSKDMAMQLVYDFEHGVIYRSECSCGASEDHTDQSDAYRWEFGKHRTKHKGVGEHIVKVRETGGFAFSDVGDWPIHKLNYHYVYQCHAAVWAIAQYDAAKSAKAVA